MSSLAVKALNREFFYNGTRMCAPDELIVLRVNDQF
jgi:hypothetical protein